MGFEGPAGVLADFLGAGEALADPDKDISLIAKRHVGELLRNWGQLLGCGGLFAEEFLADCASTHGSA
jgi:hypothetical protein